MKKDLFFQESSACRSIELDRFFFLWQTPNISAPVSIYPNPFNNLLMITFSPNTSTDVEAKAVRKCLYNGEGTLVRTLTIQEQSFPASSSLGFVPNQGQFVDKEGASAFLYAKFTDAQSQEFWLTQEGFTLVHLDSLGKFSRENISIIGGLIRSENIEYADPFPYHFNYFYPHCPQGIYGVKVYRKIRIKEIFQGVDLEFTYS